MQLKPIAAIAVLLLVVASPSAAGCISNSNNTATSPTLLAHDAVLEKLIEAIKQEAYGNASNTVRAWEVTWNNATSATILFAIVQKSSGGNINSSLNTTISGNYTFRSFPTTQDATRFINGFDKTNYSLTSTDYKNNTSSNAYYVATGHYPSVYKQYSHIEGGIGPLKISRIQQYDNIIIITKTTF